MASLKFETFLGDIPFHDATVLPEQNSRGNRDCWFVDGKLQPIKEAVTDGTIPTGTQTMYRYRPCPKDASQAYWITRPTAYNVAPSPIPNDKYGRLYFTRKSYTVGEAVERPHFYDVKGLLGRTANTDLCTGGGTGTFPVVNATQYTLGVPIPTAASAVLTSGYTALGVSADGKSWTPASNFVGASYAFQVVGKYGSVWLAGGYNGTIARSTDGITWTNASTPIEAESYVIRCFAVGTISGTTVYVAGCDKGKILYSADGTDWEQASSLGVAVSGNILAAAFWNDRFWFGTGTGKTYRSKADPSQPNAWEDAAGPAALFVGEGISDADVWQGKLYFVGSGGKMVRSNDAGTGWVAVSVNTTGAFRSFRVSASGNAVVAVTDSAYFTAGSSFPNTFTRFPIDGNADLKEIFSGAQLKTAVHGQNDTIILAGTNGAIAVYNMQIPKWEAPAADQGVGKTPIYSVEYAAGRYVVAGGTASGLTSTVAPRYYAVTLVDGFGAEGAPVLAGRADAADGDGFNVAWSAPDFDTQGWAINLGDAKFRIYRTASSGTATDFLLVAEVPYVTNQADYDYKDTKTDDSLGEVMLSTDWIVPPAGLRGLVTLPGGVLAGFVDNTLWFSEPGQPHAWPVKYQRTVGAPIVGLSTFANSVLVTTIDRAYVATGVDPFNMSLTELETDQSCISAASVVDMGGYAIYASPRGLVKVSNMSPEWLTRQLFRPDQWAQLSPATMRATLWEGRYLAFFDAPQNGLSFTAPNVHSFAIVPGADVDGVAWFSQAGGDTFTDAYDDKVYFQDGVNRKVWNAGTTYKTCLWTSKLLQTPASISFSWMQVQTAGELGTATVRYYSEEGYTLVAEVTFAATNYTSRRTAVTGKIYNPDGTVKGTFSGTTYDATMRLPAGRRTRFHVVEIETNVKVRQVLFTQSSLELLSQ